MFINTHCIYYTYLFTFEQDIFGNFFGQILCFLQFLPLKFKKIASLLKFLGQIQKIAVFLSS